jgi:GT2 family glycosyltransferase
VIAAAMSSRFGVGNSRFRTEQGKTAFVDTIPFPAYRRTLMDRTGPYDEEMVRNQDDEYNYRLRKLGARLLLAADIRSRYYSRASFRRLWRQYFQYGYWKVRVLQKHPREVQRRQFVPVLFVSTLLLLGIAAPFLATAGWALAALVAVYLVANLAASLRASGGKFRRIGPTCLAFATLHFGYGLGFLAGLARFWNRWGGASAPASGQRDRLSQT